MCLCHQVRTFFLIFFMWEEGKKRKGARTKREGGNDLPCAFCCHDNLLLFVLAGMSSVYHSSPLASFCFTVISDFSPTILLPLETAIVGFNGFNGVKSLCLSQPCLLLCTLPSPQFCLLLLLLGSVIFCTPPIYSFSTPVHTSD